jgi:hypothetical protein
LKAPSFCHECGSPYPWTTRRIEAAIELAEEADALDQDEQAQLKATFDDLVRESPRTIAVGRFKRLVKKLARRSAKH